jgi:hypothetical protein
MGKGKGKALELVDEVGSKDEVPERLARGRRASAVCLIVIMPASII